MDHRFARTVVLSYQATTIEHTPWIIACDEGAGCCHDDKPKKPMNPPRGSARYAVLLWLLLNKTPLPITQADTKDTFAHFRSGVRSMFSNARCSAHLPLRSLASFGSNFTLQRTRRLLQVRSSGHTPISYRNVCRDPIDAVNDIDHAWTSLADD